MLKINERINETLIISHGIIYTCLNEVQVQLKNVGICGGIIAFLRITKNLLAYNISDLILLGIICSTVDLFEFL